MALTTYEGLLETMADGIETMEQNLENLYGPAMITPALPSVTTADGMLEAVAEQTELAAWNFAKMYNYLTTETNTKRIVDVPDTALFYGQFVKIGGHTVAESDELLSAEVTSVISKDAAGNTLQTYPIPAEVRNLEGYGWSAGAAYNYIDFERKKFVKCVGRVELGGELWELNSNGYFRAFSSLPCTANTNQFNLYNGICNRYAQEPRFYVTINDANARDKSIAWMPSAIFVRDSSYADAPTFKSAMSGVYLYYELATPIETDISQYLTDTDIKVVPGGALTFDNSNDLDVPSEVRYIS